MQEQAGVAGGPSGASLGLLQVVAHWCHAFRSLPEAPWQLKTEEWLLRAGRSVSLSRELRLVNPELFDVKFLCFFFACVF